jgi:hypothetical protein
MTYNWNSASAGLCVPPTLLTRADEGIEEVRFLLHCICRLMAHRAHSRHRINSVAIGAKRKLRISHGKSDDEAQRRKTG